MYYGSYPYTGWFSPWGQPMGMGHPMMGGWGFPYGGMSQMPYYPPPGGFGTPGMSQMPNYQPPGGFGTPGMSQMPNYQPPGGFGTPGMSQMPYYPEPGGLGPPGMSPFGAPMAPDQEINYLRDQAQMLKQQMDQIDARIKELEKVTQ